MNAELVTALLRATNDGVIPPPFPGEDTHDYRLRCALAGASVALAQLREQAAKARDLREAEHHKHTERVTTVLEDPPVSPGRPSDVTVTSPASPENPVQHIVDPEKLARLYPPNEYRTGGHSNGQHRPVDEIGVD